MNNQGLIAQLDMIIKYQIEYIIRELDKEWLENYIIMRVWIVVIVVIDILMSTLDV